MTFYISSQKNHSHHIHTIQHIHKNQQKEGMKNDCKTVADIRKHLLKYSIDNPNYVYFYPVLKTEFV